MTTKNTKGVPRPKPTFRIDELVAAGRVAAPTATPTALGQRLDAAVRIKSAGMLGGAATRDRIEDAADTARIGEDGEPRPASDRPIGTASPGRLMAIPLHLLDDSPEQANASIRESHVEELAESIRETGLQEPIKVRPSPARPGRFETIAGHHRRRAVTRLGWSEIQALVDAVDERQARVSFLVTNEARRVLSDWERARQYHAALNVEPKVADSQRQLARLIARSEPSVSKCLAMLKLPPAITALLESRPRFVTADLAAEIQRLLKEHPANEEDIIAEVRALHDAFGTERYRSDRDTFRAAVLARIGRHASRVAPRSRRAFHVGSDGSPVLVSQIRGNGVFIASPKGVPPERIHQRLIEVLASMAAEFDDPERGAPGG